MANASLVVEPGETVALTGPSGVGKSTLLGAVLGFVAPDEGRVRVSGTDLGALSLEQWRERIAWVPQRPHLFAGTIAENVRLARPDADDTAVRDALRDAGALEFVTALPDGLGTELGEGGAGLSAGQRQRLALARAFLADRPVLLLDEPTAALDGATEAGIVDAVRRLSAGRTVLLVVHRPALLAVADRVVELRSAGDGGAARGAGEAAVATTSRTEVSVPAPAMASAPEPVTAPAPASASGGPTTPRTCSRGCAGPPGDCAGGSRWRCCWGRWRSARPWG